MCPVCPSSYPARQVTVKTVSERRGGIDIFFVDNIMALSTWSDGSSQGGKDLLVPVQLLPPPTFTSCVSDMVFHTLVVPQTQVTGVGVLVFGVYTDLVVIVVVQCVWFEWLVIALQYLSGFSCTACRGQ